MKARLLLAALLATFASLPPSVQNASAVYCYAGDPPAVYQACLLYNSGIGQQVNNENQLISIQNQYNNTVAQINAIDALISSLKNQTAAPHPLTAQTPSPTTD